MPQSPLNNLKLFSDKVLGSLPFSYFVDQLFFMDHKRVSPQKKFDYLIEIVTNTSDNFPSALFFAPKKDLTFLECLLLREAIKAKEIETYSPFVIGVQFKCKAQKKDRGKFLNNSFKCPTAKHAHLTQLLKTNIDLVSQQSPFGNISLFVMASFVLFGYFEDFLEKEELDEKSIDFLNKIRLQLVKEVGFGKLLTIAELKSRSKRRQLLTKENEPRIKLLRNLIIPPYNMLPEIKADYRAIIWAHMPARFIILGPILDFINALLNKKTLKLCKNCGKFFIPAKIYGTEKKYCSSECRKRAQSKRFYKRHGKTKKRSKEKYSKTTP